MRLRFLALLLILQCTSPLFVSAQNIDSLTRAVDSSRKALEQSEKDFQRWQDSVNHQRIVQDVQRNGQTLDQFLLERQETERKEKRQLYIRLAMGAVFLTVLMIGIARRRKRLQDKS